jgi:tyrosinase
MGRLSLVLYVLAIFLSSYSSIAHKRDEPEIPHCSKFLTRKEWRTLNYSEKARWVGAVKVRPTSSHTCW